MRFYPLPFTTLNREAAFLFEIKKEFSLGDLTFLEARLLDISLHHL